MEMGCMETTAKEKEIKNEKKRNLCDVCEAFAQRNLSLKYQKQSHTLSGIL